MRSKQGKFYILNLSRNDPNFEVQGMRTIVTCCDLIGWIRWDQLRSIVSCLSHDRSFWESCFRKLAARTAGGVGMACCDSPKVAHFLRDCCDGLADACVGCHRISDVCVTTDDVWSAIRFCSPLPAK